MSLNGSGVFNVNSAGQPVVSGTLITATAFNAAMQDIATALSTALYKDGQQTVLANIPVGGFKLTGLGAGSMAGDSVRYEQAALRDGAQVQEYSRFTAGGLVDAMTGTLSPVIAAYAAGLRVTCIPNLTNTSTAPTLNLNALGVKTVKKRDEAGTKVALAAGDYNTSGPFTFEYDGTDFILLDPVSRLFESLQFSATVDAFRLTISAGYLVANFRSDDLTDGAVTRVAGAPADLVIAGGSTLGTTGSLVKERIAVLAVLTSSNSIVLAVTRVTDGKLLVESDLITTTAEAGDGDSGVLIYATAAHTSRPFRILGYLESAQANAGLWASAPTVIQSVSPASPIQAISTVFASDITGLSSTVTDITGIPEWMKEITVCVNNLSTNGSSIPIVQFGNDDGWITSGYDGHGMIMLAVGTTASAAITNGVALDGAWASSVELTGVMVAVCAYHTHVTFTGVRTSATPGAVVSAGYLAPSPPINKVRITTVGGTDTFDGGYVIVRARA